MAIVKMTSSGKAMQFIDDLGFVHQVACSYLMGYITNKGEADYISLTRMPLKVSTDRYKGFHKITQADLTGTDLKADAHSTKTKKEVKQKKAYSDAKVW